MNQFVSFLICNNSRSNTIKKWAIGGKNFNDNFYKSRNNLGNTIQPKCLLPRGYGGMNSFMIELDIQGIRNIKTVTMIKSPPASLDIKEPDGTIFIENLIERQKNHIIFSLIEPVYGFRKYEFTNPFKMDEYSGIHGVISPEKTFVIKIEFEDTKFSFIP